MSEDVLESALGRRRIDVAEHSALRDDLLPADSDRLGHIRLGNDVHRLGYHNGWTRHLEHRPARREPKRRMEVQALDHLRKVAGVFILDRHGPCHGLGIIGEVPLGQFGHGLGDVFLRSHHHDGLGVGHSTHSHRSAGEGLLRHLGQTIDVAGLRHVLRDSVGAAHQREVNGLGVGDRRLNIGGRARDDKGLVLHTGRDCREHLVDRSGDNVDSETGRSVRVAYDSAALPLQLAEKLKRRVHDGPRALEDDLLAVGPRMDCEAAGIDLKQEAGQLLRVTGVHRVRLSDLAL